MHPPPPIPCPQVKAACFRVVECQEVLSNLGLPKSGKKDDLTRRILSIFQDAAAL
jgi:hypothetical protein